MTKCDSKYHPRGRERPDAIAVLTRIKGTADSIGEKQKRCYDHVVNTLTYWYPFWKLRAIDEDELASARRAAGGVETTT